MKDLLRKHSFLVRWDLNPLSEDQLNMQRALKYYLKITAFRDQLETVNTEPPEANMDILKMSFGYYDSAVVPCWAFDGCVTEYKRLSQTW